MRAYDPFASGPCHVEERTFEARDDLRDRVFPIEVWQPIDGRRLPLILFSHASGNHRRGATFLTTHLASHGYMVAAMNHSEVVAPELGRQMDETAEKKAARLAAVIAARVPDIRFLLDHLLSTETEIDAARIGIAGHSFGGWTALATLEADQRLRAVVAIAPGGASNPRPGIIPSKLNFNWGRDVPTLILAAENDVPIPLGGIYEIFDRTPATKRIVILRRADHMHFMDNVEQQHETVRNMQWPAELEWMQKEMRPIAELCSGEQAHAFTRGLTLAHMDAYLRRREDAHRFLEGDLETELGSRGVEAFVARQRDPNNA